MHGSKWCCQVERLVEPVFPDGALDAMGAPGRTRRVVALASHPGDCPPRVTPPVFVDDHRPIIKSKFNYRRSLHASRRLEGKSIDDSIEQIDQTNSFQLLQYLQTLSTRSCDLSNNPNILLDKYNILYRINSSISSCSVSTLSSYIWYMGSLKLHVATESNSSEGKCVPALCYETTVEILEHLSTILERDSQNIELPVNSDIYISKLFIGLARLNFSGTQQSHLMTLMTILASSIKQLGGRSLSNVLWSLGSMGIQRQQIYPKLREMMFKRIYITSETWTGQTVSLIVYSLCKFGYLWAELPRVIQTSLSIKICQLCVKFSSQSLGNILYSLGKMGLSYEILSENMKFALEVSLRKSVPKSENRDLMQIVHGLSLLEFEWKYLSNQTKNILSFGVFKRSKEWINPKFLSVQNNYNYHYVYEYSSILFHLSQMDIDYHIIPSTLRSGILIGLTSICNFNNTEYLLWNKDEYIRLEKLKYGLLHKHSSGKKETKSSAADDGSGTLTVDELVNLYSIAVPNIWIALSNMKISFRNQIYIDSFSESSPIPVPILSRFYSLTALFTGDFTLQGVSMISYSLSKMNAVWTVSRMQSPASTPLVRSKSRKSYGSPSKIPYMLCQQLVNRLLLLIDENQAPRKAYLDHFCHSDMHNELGNYIELTKVLTYMGKMGYRHHDVSLEESHTHLTSRFLKYVQSVLGTGLQSDITIKEHDEVLKQNKSNQLLFNVSSHNQLQNELRSLDNLNVLLTSLSSIKLQWVELNSQLKERLGFLIENSVSVFTQLDIQVQPEEVLQSHILFGAILTNLGTMGIRFEHRFVGGKQLAQEVVEFMIRNIYSISQSSNTTKFQSTVVISILKALVSMKYSLSQHHIELLAPINKLLENDMFRSDPVNFSLLLYYFGKLDIYKENLIIMHQPTNHTLSHNLEENLSYLLSHDNQFFSFQILSNVLKGLEYLKFGWVDLSLNLRNLLLNRLSNLINSSEYDLSRFNVQSVVSCLTALASMYQESTQIHAFASENITSSSIDMVRRHFIAYFEQNGQHFSPLEARLALRSFADLRWESFLPKSIKTRFIDIIGTGFHVRNELFDFHVPFTQQAIFDNSNMVRTDDADFFLGKEAAPLSFTPYAYIKLICDINDVKWHELTKITQMFVINSIVSNNYDSATSHRSLDNRPTANYAQFRSFLNRLVDLHFSFHELLLSDYQLCQQFSTLVMNTIHGLLLHQRTSNCTESGKTLSTIAEHNSDVTYNRKYSFEVFDVLAKLSFKWSHDNIGSADNVPEVDHMESSTSSTEGMKFTENSSKYKYYRRPLPYRAKLHAISRPLVSPMSVGICNSLLESSSEYVLFQPIINLKLSHLISAKAYYECEASRKDRLPEVQLVIKMMKNVLSWKPKWDDLLPSNRRYLLRIISVSLLFSQEYYEMITNCNVTNYHGNLLNEELRNKSELDSQLQYAIETYEDLFRTSLILLTSLRQPWASFPTRQRNLLSSILEIILSSCQPAYEIDKVQLSLINSSNESDNLSSNQRSVSNQVELDMKSNSNRNRQSHTQFIDNIRQEISWLSAEKRISAISLVLKALKVTPTSLTKKLRQFVHF